MATARIIFMNCVERRVPAGNCQDEVGPIQFIQNVQSGYLFTLGMNLVYVSELDVELIKYDE